jgi:hypothetical protein
MIMTNYISSNRSRNLAHLNYVWFFDQQVLENAPGNDGVIINADVIITSSDLSIPGSDITRRTIGVEILSVKSNPI